MPTLNDVQSRLNETEIRRVIRPVTPEDVRIAIRNAASNGLAMCAAGALHSMGGQQFAASGVSMSSSQLTRIGPLDSPSTSVWAQSGVTWPSLVRWLHDSRRGSFRPYQ